MNKLFTFLLIYLLINIGVFGQKRVYEDISQAKQQISAQNYASLFAISPNTNAVNTTAIFKTNNSAITLTINQSTVQQLETQKPNFCTITIPVSSQKSITLELIPIQIFAPNFRVIDSKNQVVNINKGIYYKGIIQGDKNSVVSIGIANGEISGVISNDEGNFIIGKLDKSSEYIYYNDKDLILKSGFICGVEDNDLMKPLINENKANSTTNNVACSAVDIYVEADNAIYTAQGSNMTTASNFVNALFGQVAVLYNNENITIQISELKIWNTADPYISATTTSNMLNAFGTQVGNTFNGDLAHLISGRSLGGGVAWLDVLCSKGTGISANINSTVVNVPTYSWNVEVVTHEMGHNFGSPHTQSCSWVGGAIDNCYTTEGGCPAGPAPVNGGTIMSYCHLTGYGINFNHGFGTQPGDLIRNRTQSCFGSAVAPTNLTVVENYSTAVTLSWQTGVGSATYTLEYKPTLSSTWTSTTTNTNSILLSGLTANTNYDWRVKTSCSSFTNSVFSTNNTPPITYCAINHTIGCNTYAIGIDDIILNNINYNPSSGCTSNGGYSFVFTPIQTLIIGQTYNLTINPLWIGGNSVQAAIWIDYNKNGTYESTEKVFTTSISTKNPITGAFTLASNLTPKSKTRMRVILNVNNAPTNPCGTYTYGETEEFLINIVSPCPQTLTLASPTDDISTGTSLKQASATTGIINASNKVIGTGTNVSYQAKVINLNPGFKSDTGSIFKAELGGCN